MISLMVQPHWPIAIFPVVSIIFIWNWPGNRLNPPEIAEIAWIDRKIR